MRLLIALLLLTGSIAGGWFWWESRGITVSIATPTRGPAVEAVYATGVIEPVRWAKVGPVTNGRVAAISVGDGDRVTEGAVLARLDDREPRANLAQLQAREKFLREEVDRLRPLRDRGVIAQQTFDRAVSDHDQVVAQAEASRKQLTDRTLTAPIGGVILRQDGLIGEFVEAGRVLFWVGQPRPFRVVVDVDEQDIPFVRPGQRALVRADAYPDKAIEGKVADVTPKGDPTTQTYRVYVQLPDDAPLFIGMTVEVNIVLRETADAILVPLAAVRDGRLFVVKDERAEARTVRTGAIGSRRIEVRDGLAEDENFVADPPPGLKPGTRLRARSD
ncbi:MAG: efflux RND transporter periplasmic adaptor subunit [Alphaproteobacteria bacterium]|nr:efflux RND transporter periplasmic adaptor subunit [Alphaproteobacteria bacterium]